MNIIPIVSMPYPDELLYSWIQRLAKRNGVTFQRFVAVYTRGVLSAKRDVSYDFRQGLFSLQNSMCRRLPLQKIAEEGTTILYEALSLSSWELIRNVNLMFREPSKLNSTSSLFFHTLNACPQCLKEDMERFGEPYLHTSHHLSGVSVCTKHKCRLHTFKGRYGQVWDLSDFQEIQSERSFEEDWKYAEYAQALFRAKPNTNASLVKAALRRKAPALPIKSTESTENLQRLLMEYYPNVEEALTHISQEGSLIREYRCPDCELHYYSTEEAQENGWGCPYCDQDTSDEEQFQRITHTMWDEDYLAMGEFRSLNEKVTFYHKKCRCQIQIKPRAFLFAGTQCKCVHEVSFEEAKQKVARTGDFELLAFSGTDPPCTIRAGACGHTFDVRLQKFLKSPQCRVCFPSALTSEYLRDRIRLQSNGEYELVGDYVDQDTRIRILHTKCGHITEYSMKYYYVGAKCPFCTGKYASDWDKMFVLLQEYKAEFGSLDIPKRDSYKGENLGLWTQRQRKLITKEQTPIVQERIRKLRSIGYDFDPLETEWQRRFEQYQRYITERGTVQIARRTMFEGEHLGAWVETQRKWYQAGKMSSERKEKLLSVNPKLFTRSDSD